MSCVSQIKHEAVSLWIGRQVAVLLLCGIELDKGGLLCGLSAVLSVLLGGALQFNVVRIEPGWAVYSVCGF